MRSLRDLPKTHLHVHLESAIRPATLVEIAASNGLPMPPPPPTDRRFPGFRAFGDHGSEIRDRLRTAADFERVAIEFCHDQAADGVRYVEVTLTAASHGERLGDPELPLAAVLAGLRTGCAATGLRANVILDHSRRRPLERFRRTLALAREFGPDGSGEPAVVAIGLAGEERYPLAPFAPVLDDARAAGVNLVHHAGEAAGPASVLEAARLGHAQRIGHGFRVIEDHDAVAELVDRGVAVEGCISSNVALGFAPNFAAHPLPLLREQGVAISLNTDIPATLGIDLTGEYERAASHFGWETADLADVARSALDSSFAPPEVRSRVEAEIDDWLARP